MHYNDVVKLLEYSFKKVGFEKGSHKSWLIQSRDITLAVYFTVQDVKKDFNIDMGIIFNKYYPKWPVKKFNIRFSHFWEAAHNILAFLEEPQYRLDYLFSYHPDINSDVDIIDNISDIMDLYKTKLLPYFDQFNNFKFVFDNFESIIMEQLVVDLGNDFFGLRNFLRQQMIFQTCPSNPMGICHF